MDVALVPLKFESGTRFKILEAAACGVPMVSTSLGAEGLPLVDGQHLLLADAAEAFAGAVVRLLSEREFAKRMAEKARHFILTHYSVDALAAEARTILGRLRPCGRVNAQKTQSTRVNHDPCKRTAVERQ
jgi:glycosyltransferase involved in cell wall biosynthesis